MMTPTVAARVRDTLTEIAERLDTDPRVKCAEKTGLADRDARLVAVALIEDAAAAHDMIAQRTAA